MTIGFPSKLTDKDEKNIIVEMRNEDIDPIIQAALEEDMPQGDITSENIIPSESKTEAIILSKEEGVLAGIEIAKRVFELLNPDISFEEDLEDGQVFGQGDRLARIKGHSISILKGERVALNFLQRLSGIAAITQEYVKALAGTKTKILDTRKTTPGLRILEKYAVRMGGGSNHRLNLSEMILIKDNHLKLVGNISEAVMRAKEKAEEGIKIEVEASTFEEVKEAVQVGVDMIMLDNMPLKNMEEVVRWVDGRVPLEVSGKISLGQVREIGSLGVDFISVGSLTHSYKSVDLSLEFLGPR